jgi:hypothetical protein
MPEPIAAVYGSTDKDLAAMLAVGAGINVVMKVMSVLERYQ